MDSLGDPPKSNGQQLEPLKPIAIINVASGFKDVQAMETQVMDPKGSSPVNSEPATISEVCTPFLGTMDKVQTSQSPSRTPITTLTSAKNVKTIAVMHHMKVAQGTGINQGTGSGPPMTLNVVQSSGPSSLVPKIISQSVVSGLPVPIGIVQSSISGSPVKVGQKTVNLLMTPASAMARQGPKGTGEGQMSVAQDGLPKPVHLVTRLIKAVPHTASPPTSSGQLVPVSQGVSTATDHHYSKEYKMTLGRKSVSVVTVSPKGTPPSTDTYPTANLSGEEKEEYNKTLLDYINKTMCKSGRITLIKDMFDLRSLVNQAENKLVIIDFFSMGNPSCHTIASRLQQMSLNYPDIIFLKVDVVRSKECSVLYDIKSTPTFVMLQGGVKIYQLQGADVSELEEKIKVLQRETPLQIRLLKTPPVKESGKGLSNIRVMKTPPNTSKNPFPPITFDPTKTWLLDPVTGNLREMTPTPMAATKKSTGLNKLTILDPKKSTLLAPIEASIITQGNEDQLVDVENCEDSKSGVKPKSIPVKNSSTSEERPGASDKGDKLPSCSDLTNAALSALHCKSKLKQGEHSQMNDKSFWDSIRRADDSDNDETYEEIDPDEIMKAEDETSAIAEPQKPRTKTIVGLLTQETPNIKPPEKSLNTLDVAYSFHKKGIKTYGRVPSNINIKQNSKPITLKSTKQPTARKSTSCVYVAKNMSNPALVTKHIYENHEDSLVSKEQQASQLKYFSISNRPREKESLTVDNSNAFPPQNPVVTEKTTPSSPLMIRIDPPPGSVVLKSSTKRTIQDYLISSSTPKKIKLEPSPNSECVPTSTTASPPKTDISEKCKVILSRDPNVENLVMREVVTRSVKRQRSESVSDQSVINKKPHDDSVKKDITDGTSAEISSDKIKSEDDEEKTCAVCGKEFDLSSSLKRHIAALHHQKPQPDIQKLTGAKPNDEEEKSCGICGKEFEHNSSLRRHVASLHQKPQPDLQEPTEAKVTRTTPRTVFDKSKLPRCMRCRKIFANKHSLIRHMRTIHQTEVETATFVSPRTTAESPVLRERRRSASVESRNTSEKGSSSHITSEGETTCGFCGKKFNFARSLKRHIGTVHQHEQIKQSDTKATVKENDHSCQKCNRVYSSLKNLQQHIKSIHKIPSGEFHLKSKVRVASKDVSKPKADSRPSTSTSQCSGNSSTCFCKKCGQKYSNVQNLRRHQIKRYGKFYGILKSGEKTINEKKQHSKSLPKPDVPCYICKCGEKYVSFMRLMRHISLDHKKTKILKEEFSDGDNSADEIDDESDKGSEISSDEEEDMELKSEDSPSENEEVSEDSEENSQGSKDEDSASISCEMCDQEFNSMSNLRHHYHTLHKITKTQELFRTTCDKCGKKFSNEANMKRHYTIVHGSMMKEPLPQKRLKCKRCGLKFSSIEKYHSHSEKVHKVKVFRPKQSDSKEMLSCYKCGSKYLFYGNLLHHLQKAHSVKFKDPSTLKHFLEKKKKIVKTEEKSKVKVEEPESSFPEPESVSCYKCGRSFNLFMRLFYHLKNYHKKLFKNVASLKKFMENESKGGDGKSQETSKEKEVSDQENKEVLKCTKCDRKYYLYRNLLSHVRKIHGMKFRDTGTLKAYFKKRNAVKKEVKKTDESKENNSERFKCQKCGRLYFLEGNLVRHYQLIHNIQTPQITPTTETVADNDECKSCSKYTPLLKDLRRHLHLEHSCRLPGWKDKDNKTQIRFLCLKIREMDESKNCDTCTRGLTLKKPISRHCDRQHSSQRRTSAGSSKHKPSSSKLLVVKIPSKSTPEATGVQKNPHPKPQDDTPVVSQSDDSQASQEMEFYCVACGMGFWRADSLLRHQNKLLPEKSQKCLQCGAGFRSCNALSMHSAAGCNTPVEEGDGNESMRYKCEICRESFSQLQTLVRHHKNQHNKYSIYNCRFCPGTFRTLSYLRYHIHKSHADEAENNDDNLSVGTPSENIEDLDTAEDVRPTGNLWQNQSSAGIKTEPGENFTQGLTRLKEHLGITAPQVTGTTIKTERQDYVEQTSGMETNLPAEENMIDTESYYGETEGSTDTNSPGSFVKTADGRYQCKNCGSCFQYLKSLIQHQKIQHKSTRHKCSKCPASFHTRIYLLYHCKSQHGITDPETQRPVGLTSATKSASASKHCNPGEGESLATPSPYRYNCPMCPTGFRTFFYLSYHLEQFHGINDLDDQAYEGALRNSHAAEGGSQKSQLSPNRRMATGEKIGTFRNGRHFCNTCGASFEAQKSLKEHFRKQHAESGNEFKCLMCNANFRTKKSMLMHKNTQHGPVKPGQKLATFKNGHYSCTACGAMFGMHKSLKSHYYKQHRHDATWECPVCNVKFLTQKYMVQHEKLRHGSVDGKKVKTSGEPTEPKAPPPCDHCGARFIRLRNLKAHVADQHVIINFRCKDCSAGFTTHYAFTVHCRRRHGKQNQDQVKAKEKTPVKIAKTIAIDPKANFFLRDDGRFECKICAAHFKYRKNVPYHLKEAHSARTVTCSHCSAFFSREKFLKHHMKMRHNIDIPKPKPKTVTQERSMAAAKSDKGPKTPNFHVCGLCKVGFMGLSNIRDHVKRHHQFITPEFRCDKCGETFMKHFFYKTHMRRHSVFVDKQVVEEPVLEGTLGYKCNICHTYCQSLRYLNQHHSQQHRGIRQVCLLCHGGFDRKGQLEQHLKRIHGLVEIHTGEYSLNLASYQLKNSNDKTSEKATTVLENVANQNGADDLDSANNTMDISQDETGSRFLQDPCDIEISLEDSDNLRSESDQLTEVNSKSVKEAEVTTSQNETAAVISDIAEKTETRSTVNVLTPSIQEPGSTAEIEPSPMKLKISATMSLQYVKETATGPLQQTEVVESSEKLMTPKVELPEEIVELPTIKPVPEFIDLTELSDVEDEKETSLKVAEQPKVKQEVDSDVEVIEGENVSKFNVNNPAVVHVPNESSIDCFIDSTLTSR